MGRHEVRRSGEDPDDAAPGGYPPSPVPGDADPWPGEKPFTAFGQFGPDTLDLRVFDQDRFWVDRHGTAHLLDAMPDDYRRNVIVFLVERTDRFWVDACLRAAIQAAGDALLGRVSGEILVAAAGGPAVADLAPSDWLESTPLMRRLRQLTAAS